MDAELKIFLKQVISKALFFSVLIFAAAYFTFGIKPALAVVTGGVLSALGFFLSTAGLRHTITSGQNPWLPSLISMAKAVVTAGAAAFFFIRYGLSEGLFFMAGFIMIFPSIYLYSQYNEKKNPMDMEKIVRIEEDEKTEETGI